LRKNGVVLAQQIANRVQIFAGNVIFHQRPIEAGNTGGRGEH